MDKAFALRIVDAVEKLYIENLALKGILETNRASLPPQSQIDLIIAEAKAHPQIAGTIHQQFEPLRARIREDIGLEQAIQELLRVVPPSKDVN